LNAPSRQHRRLDLQSGYSCSDQPILRQPCVWLCPVCHPCGCRYGCLVEDHSGGFRIEPIRPEGVLVGFRPSKVRLAEVRRSEVRPSEVRPFEQSLSQLDEDFPDRVVQFNTGSAQRMTRATVAMFEAIVDGRLSHNGDPALVRHFSNAILREDARGGSRITKNHKGSTRKIDAAVASLIAHHRAAVWREVEAPAEPQLLVL